MPKPPQNENKHLPLCCVTKFPVFFLSEDDLENDAESINPEDLIGEWAYYTQEYKDNFYSELPYLVTDCALDRYYKFKADGTEERYDYDQFPPVRRKIE